CCGRGAVDSAAGVTIRTKGKKAFVSGIVRCSKIWLDPVCSAKIRATRAEEISAALVRHIQEGGTAYMVTLTLQHHKRHKLADLLDSLGDAWKALLSGSQWAGDPKRGRKGERARMGVLGFVRSIEATYGENGWHPHIHVILLLGAEQSPRPSVPKKEIKDPVTGEKIPNPAREGWVKQPWDPTPVGYFPVPDPSWDRSAMSAEVAQTAADFERMQER
ncbi:protein rep, partial [Nocardiopsis tropica]